MFPIDLTEQRKNDHVKLADGDYDKTRTDFEDVRLVYSSLGHFSIDDITLSQTFLNHSLSSPLFINAMTGGSEYTQKINEDLSIVAREADLPMASGSESAVIRKRFRKPSFSIIRENNPNGFIIANIDGSHTLENAQFAIDILEANALQIHLNTPQEMVMPEGDRDFRYYEEHIIDIVEHINVPVIVKEVGFGMSRETIEELLHLGVKTIDVSGRGGTNFSRIENNRRPLKDMAYLEDWGQSTVISLLEAQEYLDQLTLIASGGIKNPLQAIKALALGADMTGMSVQFLHSLLHDGIDATVQMANDFKEQMRLIMLMLNAPTLADLKKTDLVITGYPKEWAEQRGIETKAFASRKKESK